MALLSYVDYNVTHGGTVALLDISYPSAIETFTELIKPFTDLKPAFTQIQNDVPWDILLTQLGFHLDLAVCEKEQQHSLYSVATKTLFYPDYIYGFNKFDKLYNTYPETLGSTLEIEFFPNQAVLAVPPSLDRLPLARRPGANHDPDGLHGQSHGACGRGSRPRAATPS